MTQKKKIANQLRARTRARNRCDFPPRLDCDKFHKRNQRSRDDRQLCGSGEEVSPSSVDIPTAGDVWALQGCHPIHPADRHHHTGMEEEDSLVGSDS